jgi:hypothetical protein
LLKWVPFDTYRGVVRFYVRAIFSLLKVSFKSSRNNDMAEDERAARQHILRLKESWDAWNAASNNNISLMRLLEAQSQPPATRAVMPADASDSEIPGGHRSYVPLQIGFSRAFNQPELENERGVTEPLLPRNVGSSSAIVAVPSEQNSSLARPRLVQDEADLSFVTEHQQGNAASNNRPTQSDDEGADAPALPSVHRHVEPRDQYHPWLRRWDTIVVMGVFFVVGLFCGVSMDKLGSSGDIEPNYGNSSSNDDHAAYSKLRIEKIWNCAYQLSAGHGFAREDTLLDGSMVVVSPQQKAVDWFLFGPGSGIPAPNDDTHCQWHTPFGVLYAVLVLRGSLAIKDHSWFADIMVHNVSDVCTWKRVKCEGDAIVSLELSHANLTGSIPLEIVGLPTLTTLKLFSNPMLVGSIPEELGKLEHLEKLYIQSTSLHGMLPTQLGLLSNLDEFHLDHTLLSGVVPNEVCQLRHGKLQVLSASCGGDNPIFQCAHPECCTRCSP